MVRSNLRLMRRFNWWKKSKEVPITGIKWQIHTKKCLGLENQTKVNIGVKWQNSHKEMNGGRESLTEQDAQDTAEENQKEPVIKK